MSLLLLNQIAFKIKLFFSSRLEHGNLKTFGDITSITVIKHREFDMIHLARP